MSNQSPITSLSYNAVKRSKPYALYLFLFLMLYYAVASISKYEALDLSRYYEEAFDNVRDYTLSSLIVTRFYSWAKYDFIYQVILYIAVIWGVPLNLVTTFFLYVYYRVVAKFTHTIYKGKIDFFVMVVILLITPLTWSIEISRTLTAIVFLYSVVVFYLRKKWFLVALFSILCGLTHFPTLMYLMIFACCIPFKTVKIPSKVVLIAIFLFFVIGLIMPATIQTIMALLLSDNISLSYAHYVTDGIKSFWTIDGLGYGDRLPCAFAMVYSIVLLMLNRKQGYDMKVLFVLTVMLFFFTNSSYFFVERTMMVMPLFWGWNVATIFQNGTQRDKQKICFLSMIGIIPILLHFYAYRETYFLF